MDSHLESGEKSFYINRHIEGESSMNLSNFFYF